MARTLTAADRSALIRLAKTLPTGSDERRKLLAVLKEAAEHPEVEAFLADLEKAFRRHFPKGYFFARAGTNLGPHSIYIATATLPKGQQTNGIIQNDPSYNTFWMHDSFSEAGMHLRAKIEISQGGSLMVKPAPGSYMAFDRVKIGWRNGTAKPSSIVKKFDQYFAKLAAAVSAAKRDGTYVG